MWKVTVLKAVPLWGPWMEESYQVQVVGREEHNQTRESLCNSDLSGCHVPPIYKVVWTNHIFLLFRKKSTFMSNERG